ncbi:endonuclease/exonuclease/phosphatase family protein [Gammaproteobacteria bacterium]|nr:endonuclease/exonuclease/phosphatase family protein [Gammaproteobacteria bacterium]
MIGLTRCLIVVFALVLSLNGVAQALCISQIQGVADRSAYVGDEVTVSGVITAVDGVTKGFPKNAWVADVEHCAHGSQAAIWVHVRGGSALLKAGNVIEVSGQVKEWRHDYQSKRLYYRVDQQRIDDNTLRLSVDVEDDTQPETEIVVSDASALRLITADASIPEPVVITDAAVIDESMEGRNVRLPLVRLLGRVSASQDHRWFAEIVEGDAVDCAGVRLPRQRSATALVLSEVASSEGEPGMCLSDVLATVTEGFYGKNLKYRSHIAAVRNPNQLNAAKPLPELAKEVLAIGSVNLWNLYDPAWVDSRYASADAMRQALTPHLVFEPGAGLASDDDAERAYWHYLDDRLRAAKRKNPTRFDRLAATLIGPMRAPQVIALQEVQDNDGDVPSLDTQANHTVERLVEAVNAIGGPRYVGMVQSPPLLASTGGIPGANLQLGFLVREGLAHEAFNLLDGYYGQCAMPDERAFDGGRKPLALVVDAFAQRWLVVNLHLKSNFGYGDDQTHIPRQLYRWPQQRAVVDALDCLRSQWPTLNQMVIGDLNDDPRWSADAFEPLTEAGFVHVHSAQSDSHTYQYKGVVSTLDHALIRASGVDKAVVQVWMGNTTDGNAGGSDHNPIRLDMKVLSESE